MTALFTPKALYNKARGKRSATPGTGSATEYESRNLPMRLALISRLFAASLLSLAAVLAGAHAGDKGGAKKEPAAGKRKVLYRLNPAMQFDLFLVDAGGKRHKLTYASEEGTSNNLVFFAIDGKTFVFGVDAEAKLPEGLHGGK